jgi:hypothetical protein
MAEHAATTVDTVETGIRDERVNVATAQNTTHSAVAPRLLAGHWA